MNTQDKEHLIKKYFTARYIVDKCITRYEIFLQSVQIAVEQVQSIEIRCLEEKID